MTPSQGLLVPLGRETLHTDQCYDRGRSISTAAMNITMKNSVCGGGGVGVEEGCPSWVAQAHGEVYVLEQMST